MTKLRCTGFAQALFPIPRCNTKALYIQSSPYRIKLLAHGTRTKSLFKASKLLPPALISKNFLPLWLYTHSQETCFPYTHHTRFPLFLGHLMPHSFLTTLISWGLLTQAQTFVVLSASNRNPGLMKRSMTERALRVWWIRRSISELYLNPWNKKILNALEASSLSSFRCKHSDGL